MSEVQKALLMGAGNRCPAMNACPRSRFGQATGAISRPLIPNAYPIQYTLVPRSPQTPAAKRPNRKCPGFESVRTDPRPARGTDAETAQRDADSAAPSLATNRSVRGFAVLKPVLQANPAKG